MASIVLAAGTVAGCGDDSGTAESASDSSTTTAEDSSGITLTDTTSASSVDDSSSSEGGSSGESGGSTGVDTGSTSEDSGSSGDTTTGEDSSSTGDVMDVCPAGDLGNVVPSSIDDSTLNADHDFAGSCGGAGAPDQGYTFTAPADGPYTFDTEFSALDTVLYVLDGVCMGTELACNDDGAGTASVVTTNLVAGQTVTAIVDGFGVAGAPFTLRVRSGSYGCPTADLGNTVPNSVDGDTSDQYDGFASSCGGDEAPDSEYLFTAPADGTYSFDTFGSMFEAIVYVLDGTCEGAQLVCGMDGVIVDMVAGQTVTVVVDSFFESGAFELHVDQLGGMCPDGDLGGTVPVTIGGDTSDGDNTMGGSCGGNFSPDDTYTFSAPADGLYAFDTIGSAYDTVLYVLQDDCDGAEIGCNDDINFQLQQSRFTTGLVAGETVVVAVDGNGAGAYQLNVDAVPCPDDDLGNVAPQVAFQTTFAGINKLSGSCGGLDSPDYAYSFTAPDDGEYTFDTFGTGFDTVLYAFEGGVCAGMELACNDNFQFNQTSVISVPMNAGESITVVVDGQFESQGVFQLNVGQLGGGACPDVDLGSMVPNGDSGTTVGGDNTVAGTCGGFTQPDDTFLFTAPMDGLYAFDTFGSTFDTILYLRDGGCQGPEIVCNNDAGFGLQSQVSAGLSTGQTVMVAVDGNVGAGAYDLNIEFVPCPDLDIGGDVPDVQMGSTSGLVDKLQMVGCFQSDQGSADFAFLWTAPAAGNYTFDTVGSVYDTVLYVTEGNQCGGQELACNDDFNGLQSQVGVNLAAGESVIIVVSGYFGDEGNFTLNVN